MNKCRLFRKTVAWLLITTLINPALVAPAFARDTDIYLQTTSGTSSAEPNVLFVLGTNDRMNVAEAWREYDPNTYDSHAEYLWNDINIINGTGFAQTAESSTRISTASPPVNPFSPWGTWSGALDPDRVALWQATKAYATGTQAGDPGVRSSFRNYSDLSWYYWLPAGTATSDARLMSNSFNRFRGYVQRIAGTTPNSPPPKRGNITFSYPANCPAGSDCSTNDFRKFNQCASSLTALQPSTIFAPSNAPLNSGVYANQQWSRFEPYLALDNTTAASYPGIQTISSGYARGYLDTLGANAPARDNANTSSPTAIGDRGQPIRFQVAASNANWTDLAADMGGYVYSSASIGTCAAGATGAITAGTNTLTVPASDLVFQIGATVRIAGAGAGGVDLIATIAPGPLGPPYTLVSPAPASTPVIASTTVAFASVWQVDAAGACLGTPSLTTAELTGLRKTAYRDTYSPLLACVGSPACTVLQQEQFSAWKGTRDASPAFGMNTGTPGYYDIATLSGGGRATKTLACTYSPSGLIPPTELDATGVTRTRPGGSCTPGAITCTNTNPSAFPPAADVCTAATPTATLPANPAAADCRPLTQPEFILEHSNCGWDSRPSVTVAACAWSGRQQVLVEGQGTYFYGGTCTESGVDTSCQITGTTTLTLNGSPQTLVTGPFASPTTAANAAQGCSNAVSAGIYYYGGTCQGTRTIKNPGIGSVDTVTPSSTANCQIAGVTASQNIRGTAYTNTVLNSNTAGCNPIADVTPGQGCTGRYPGLCETRTCPLVQTSLDANANSPAYNVAAATSNFVHDCKADEPAGAYMYSNATRAFQTPWNGVISAGAANPGAAYTNSAGLAVAADATKNVDVYSVNYLNFLYGAKACRTTATGALVTAGPIGTPAAGVTCSPIARKTRLQVAKDAMSGLVASTDNVRLGLMVYNRTDDALNSDGGNVAFAIRRMGSNRFGASAADLAEYNNRAALINSIQSVVASSRTPLTETLYEAYRYFSGRTPKWGTSTTAAKGSGPLVPVTAGRETTVGTNADPDAAVGQVVGKVFLTDGSAYNSPMLNNPTVAKPANCQKNYIVMITNGQPEDDFSANADIKGLSWVNPTGQTVSPRTDVDTTRGLQSTSFNQISAIAGGNPYGDPDLAGTTQDGGFVWLDELSYFMATADMSPGAANLSGERAADDRIPGRQSVITYTIGFAGVSAPVVQNAAIAATGIYYVAQDAQQLKAALIAAFTAIRDWNPTVAAATVPISALNRGQSSTDVYLAFFAPTPQSAWQGTVKKYQLSTLEEACGTGVSLCLTGQTTINGLKNIEQPDPIGGLPTVDPNAVSGPNSDGTAWTPITLVDGAKSNLGGTGSVLIGTSGYTPETRKIYTFLSGGGSSTIDLTASGNKMHFNNAAITKTLLGNAGMTDATRETLINFIRGGNLGDARCTDGSGGTTCDTFSGWPHFGIEHSRPAIVTYDSSTAPPVQYLYYVQNNGMLTAVDAYTGREKWSFLIEEALPQLSALQANNNGPELYIADGSPEVFFEDQNGNGKVDGSDRVWLYFGLRRGGRAIYAIDITQKDAPAFKWKISADSGTGQVCTATAACASVPTLNELGQSWSTPSVARIRKLSASGDPALIFGGGYDPAEDTVPPGTRTMGRALYVINGNTAEVIKAWGAGAGMSGITFGSNLAYAIPSDVTAISTDFDAFIDRVYVGDLGGNVWRFDIDDVSENNWQGEQLASLSNPTGEKRKFFFPPAVAPQTAPFKDPYDAVYIGSGDKEHPLLTGTTTPATTDDRMFMLIDDHSLKASGRSGNPSRSTIPITLSTLLDLGLTTAIGAGETGKGAAPLAGYEGWMRELDPGEKVVNAPTVFFGTLRFGTFAPLTSLNDCTPPGTGRLNELDSLTGSFFTFNSVLGVPQRWVSGFLSAGYMSSTQLLTLQTKTGVSVFDFTCSGPNCTSRSPQKLGAPTKVYWYMEPEQ